MKAVAYFKYGPPEKVLKLSEVEKPTPKENEVLVKVRATAINDYDWSMVTGKPHLYRLMYGLIKPKHSIPGMEVAGIVESAGSSVSKFSPGDAIYGDIAPASFGTFAQYVCADAASFIKKPVTMSFEEAAAIPHASLLAWQSLMDIGNINYGQKILVNGAGGGVGTYALQIAKLFDAEVSGVDTGEKLQDMVALGYDHIIDYKQQDFTRSGVKYDLILDCKTNRSPSAYRRCLKPEGLYVTVGGKLTRLLQMFLSTRFRPKNLRLLALKPNKDLHRINELFETGDLKCLIDGPYSLEEIPKLLQYFGEGKHRGKVIVALE